MYTELYTQPRNRPSSVLIALALVAIISGALFYFGTDVRKTRASKQIVTRQEIVNVFPSQVGLFWEVETPDTGWIIYGENPSKLEQIALDERYIGGDTTKRKLHYAVLKNLTPETTYYFKIVSDDGIVSAQNNEPFSVKTSSEGIASSSLTPSYGKVIGQNGAAVPGNFVLLTILNGFPLLAVTKNTGEWLIPLQHIVNKDDFSSVPISEDTVVTFKIFNEIQESVVKAVISQTHPIPQTTVIGTNYTFIDGKEVLSATSSKSSTSSSRSLIQVLFPKQGAVIPGNTPLVKGKGVPGKEVTIRINSNPAFESAEKVDSKGEWSIPVRRAMNPGAYRLTMVTNDAQNRRIEISRDFTLIKSGERVGSVLAESTPSGSITVSPSPSPSPTLIVSAPTATPTEVIDETLTPTATPPPPVSGISVIPYLFAGMGLVLLGAGLVLVL